MFPARIGPVSRVPGRMVAYPEMSPTRKLQLMNIKMPADCFVPRLVTENALVFADFGWVSFPWTKSQRLAI
jgi:hypothetical protein